ncbi:MAG: exo-alpha-sialidase [Kofleriaceae bacterium]|nr:exo-alpha-sialidase [Kofleriaceae bacterium]
MGNVSKLAKVANTSLLPDHLAFLSAHAKSLHREDGEAFPAWHPPGKAPHVVDENAAWTNEVIEVYGSKEIETLLAARRVAFWDRRLMRHAVPIAGCGGGDFVVQVVSGRSKGHVLLVSHDAYGDFFEHLARLGDAPTSDQVVADLLHPRFDAAERIARSFADFYQQLYRGRSGQVSDEEGGYQVIKLDWELSALASDRKQLFMLGQRGRRGVLLAMGPQSSPKVVVPDAGITDASLFLHGTRLLQATRRELRVSRAGGSFRTLLRGNFIGIGGDGAGGVWAISSRRSRYSFFHSKDGARFTRVQEYDFDDILTVHGACSKGLLLSSLHEARLFLLDRKGELEELRTPRDDYFGVHPIVVTRKGTIIAGDEWRSPDLGKTWKRTTSTGGVGANMLIQTSKGVIVALCETERGDTRLLISRDEGARFSKLDVRIKGESTAIAELGDQLVIANGAQLVRIPLA